MRYVLNFGVRSCEYADINYSIKHDALKVGQDYLVNGNRLRYLGFLHINGGRAVQYRFKGEGNYSYTTKTALELDRTTIDAVV